MDGKVIHVAKDGTQTDITSGVQALYDLVIGSQDFGSGFWSYEDALPVAEVARACGFDRSEEVERYVRQALHRKESDEWQALQRFHRQAYRDGQDIPHDHVWSSVGKCMWTYCKAVRGADPG